MIRFLASEGEVAAIMREMDWSQSELGNPADWPQSLKTAISICLGSKYPMGVYWGPSHLRFYNDAYRPILGPDRHPGFIGRPGAECWPEVWDTVLPILESVRVAGESRFFEDFQHILERRGFKEETYFTFSLGPLRDEVGEVGGVFFACEETSQKVLSQRRLTMLHKLISLPRTVDETVRTIMRVLAGNPLDIPFALLYEFREGESGAFLKGWHGVSGQPGFAPGQMEEGDAIWPIFQAGGEGPLEVEPLPPLPAGVQLGPWPEPCARARVYRLEGEGADTFRGALILGTSARLGLDEGYAEFLDTTVLHAASALNAALDYDAERRRSQELQRAREEVLAANRRLSAVLESIADGFFSLDKDWHFTYVNGVAQQFWEYPVNLDMKETFFERFPANRENIVEEVFKRVRDSRTAETFEIFYEPWQKWFDNRVYPAEDGGISVFFKEITEIKEAQAEREALITQVEAERTRLAAAFMKSPAFMCILAGPTHIFEYANAEYQALIGGRDILGKSIREALPELEGQAFFGILDNVYQETQPYVGKDTEVFLQRTPGEPLEGRTVDFVYQPLTDSEGHTTGIFVHGIDITDQKAGQHEREQLLSSERAARAEAERTSRMKDEFLATLSHELRTPLNAILGWSSILRRESVNQDDLAQGLESIERNARSQTQIIEDLLDMSRIISGKVRLDVQRLDLAGVISESIETVKTAADAKGIRLQSVLDPMAGPVSGDPNRLRQVFWNLLNNAIKFTPRGGRVLVLLERVNSHVEVSVIDTGEGIRPEFLPMVFDRFRQADASTTRRHGGLGLGLAIVKQLVELHGGSVRAKSAGEGQGSTFVVMLPVVALHTEAGHDGERRHPRSESAPSSLDWQGNPKFTGLKVLVVDDEPDARALVKRLLEECEATVRMAGSAQEAFDLLRMDFPDILVSDIGMPGEDGYSLIRRVRALEEELNLPGRIPAVALTAYARAEDRMKAIRAGFQMHLSKPVEPAELITIVASLSGRLGK